MFHNQQMELLIKDFLISFLLINSSITELYCSIESSKGIYSIYIYDWIINIITNDFISLNCINEFCRCINIGDLIAVLGSIIFRLFFCSVDLDVPYIGT